MEKWNKIIFKFWYCRKSTESDERQVQSIDSQLNWMKWILWKEFENIKIFQESKSAKDPEKREEFKKLLKEIENTNKKYKWKFDFEIHIYAWGLDRLSRNPVDSWFLQYKMQKWEIFKIVCYDKTYHREDSGIFMGMINAMSNQFILDLQKNTKRWMRDKADKGGIIQRAPNWYINNKLTKEVEIATKLKPIIKEIFNLRAKKFSFYEIVRICKEKNYKTRKWNFFSKSTIEQILRNPFYIWFQRNEWILKKANHPTFIDIDLWNQVNWLKNWYKKNSLEKFIFKWIIKNFHTDKNLLSSLKIKKIKSTWEEKEYIYYHNRSTEKNKVSISQNEIIEHFDNIIHLYEIKPELKKYIWEILQKSFSEMYKSLEENRKDILKNINNLNQKINRIFELVCNWTITDEKYKEENIKLTLELENLNSELEKISQENLILNEESLFFVELLENLSTKRKTWGNEKKGLFIKKIIVELKINNKKELYIQEIKLFELIKVLNGYKWYP